MTVSKEQRKELIEGLIFDICDADFRYIYIRSQQLAAITIEEVERWSKEVALS